MKSRKRTAGLKLAGALALALGTFAAFADVYVDPDGDDSRSGATPELAVKTLSVAASLATEGAHTTIHLAPGVYTNGCCTRAEAYTYGGVKRDDRSRVVVPAGVTLVGDQGRSVTFIEGAEATSPLTGKCGTDSMRCVYLEANATVRGVTLRKGYPVSYGAGASASGGAVLAADGTSKIIDCVLSDCHAQQSPAGSRGSYLRCLITRNTAGAFPVGIGDAALIAGCVFDGNPSTAGVVNEFTRVVNCTFVNKNDNVVVRNSSINTHQVLNSVICGQYWGMYTAFSNCVFTQATSFGGTGNTFLDCTLSTVAANAVDADYRPVRGSHTGIDNAAAKAVYDRFVTPVFGADAAYDFAGGPRVLGGAMDLGAGEYDWRVPFAQDLGRRLTVPEASAGTVETANGTVRLDDGESITVGWREGVVPSGRAFRFTLLNGTLGVRLNGTPVASFTESGEWIYPPEGTEAAETDRVVFEFAETFAGGYAELLRTVSTSGLVIICR